MLVYVHIPFCHRVCPYCSFYKHTPGATPIGTFVESLLGEAQARLKSLEGQKARTLYLGGGTPSMLSPSHLAKLLGGLDSLLDFGSLDEVTLEANPATFDTRKARQFLDLGIRRVSLGIQSFHGPTLDLLGREHRPDEAGESVNILKQVGMPSVNVDLMFSIPGLSLEAWNETLDQTIRLQPDHISAYNLTYEEDTAFLDRLKKGDMDMDPDRDAGQFFLAKDLLEAAGYDHYETSNYARPGHRSSHNEGYWQGEDYLGLGPSAVSTLNRTRSQNVSDTDRYVRMIRSIGHASVDSEALDDEALRIERLALMLRTTRGAPINGLDPKKLDALASEGLAKIRNDRLVLSRKGSALVDAIVSELI